MKQFREIEPLFKEFEKTGLFSISVHTFDEKKVVIPGASPKRSKETAAKEVRQFLETANIPYKINVRHGLKGLGEYWEYIPNGFDAKEVKVPMGVGELSKDRIIETLISEKFEAISNFKICEAENKALKAEVDRLTSQIGAPDDEEEEVPVTLADRAMSLLETHQDKINPLFSLLSDKLVDLVSGTSANDSATLALFKIVLECAQGQKKLNAMETQLILRDLSKVGPLTQEFVGTFLNQYAG